MKKIAIYVCGNVSKKCVASGCLKAFNYREDSFKRYKNENVMLVSLNNCPSCEEMPLENLKFKVEKYKKLGVTDIHISTCIRGRCKLYEEFAKLLSNDFTVIGYTHGSENGKKNNNINIFKK